MGGRAERVDGVSGGGAGGGVILPFKLPTRYRYRPAPPAPAPAPKATRALRAQGTGFAPPARSNYLRLQPYLRAGPRQLKPG